MDNYKYNPIKEDTNEGKIDIINLLPKIHRESYKKRLGIYIPSRFLVFDFKLNFV